MVIFLASLYVMDCLIFWRLVLWLRISLVACVMWDTLLDELVVGYLTCCCIHGPGGFCDFG